jgi:hypothetical protein
VTLDENNARAARNDNLLLNIGENGREVGARDGSNGQ